MSSPFILSFLLSLLPSRVHSTALLFFLPSLLNQSISPNSLFRSSPHTMNPSSLLLFFDLTPCFSSSFSPSKSQSQWIRTEKKRKETQNFVFSSPKEEKGGGKRRGRGGGVGPVFVGGSQSMHCCAVPL